MIDWKTVHDRLREDAELRHAARLWSATVRLDVGEDSRRLQFDRGVLVGLDPCSPDTPCDVFVSAEEDEWQELLRPVPRPFYQDLLFANAHHGFTMNPDPLAYAAYYPAIRRIVEVLRAHRQVDGAS